MAVLTFKINFKSKENDCTRCHGFLRSVENEDTERECPARQAFAASEGVLCHAKPQRIN